MMTGYTQNWQFRKKLLLTAVAAGACGVFLGSCLARCEWISQRRDRARAKELFDGSRRAYLRTTGPRMEAAAKLARHGAGGSWAVLLLLDDDAIPGWERAWYDEAEKQLEVFDRAVIAKLISELPDETDDAILLALTRKLSDTERGRFSVSQGIPPFQIMADGTTDPIRDTARATLRRGLKTDHGFDQDAWRKAILARER